MKNIDIKSTGIGALLTSTIFLGIAATGNVGNGTVKLEGPIDLRLSFGSPKATASNTSTPTELDNQDTLNLTINHKTDAMVLTGVGFN